MIQRIYINTDEDVLTENYVDIKTDEKTKILSNAPYVKELYDLYSNNGASDYEEIKQTKDSLTKGTVIDIINNHALIELNKKYSTTIDLSREKSDYHSYFYPNNVIDLKVKTKNDNYHASFSDAITNLKYNEIFNNIGNRVAYLAKVEELIHGGYYLTIDGIKVFMPGSLAGMNKLTNFDELLNKTIYVVPVNFSNQYNMVVVSYRDYLQSLKPLELDAIKYDIEYKGKITGTSKAGIFIEFNSESNIDKPSILTGLIPVSEMDEKIKTIFDNRGYKPGDVIEFYVKNIVSDDKIILTKFFVDWEETFKNYKQDTIVNCIIVKKQDNIIFVELNNTKLIGTINNYNKEVNVGDVITLRISKIDVDTKKIFLKP